MNPHQSAVLEFQTKVAGQPIPDPFLPQRVMPDFFAKQKDIALEEWKEFKGHYDDLRRGSDDDGWRKDIADDLADTMFTVYGMANVVGEALFIIPISRTTPRSSSYATRSIGSTSCSIGSFRSRPCPASASR